MSPVVVKEKGKAEKRKKDEKEKTNNETETVTPPAKQVSIQRIKEQQYKLKLLLDNSIVRKKWGGGQVRHEPPSKSNEPLAL